MVSVYQIVGAVLHVLLLLLLLLLMLHLHLHLVLLLLHLHLLLAKLSLSLRAGEDLLGLDEVGVSGRDTLLLELLIFLSRVSIGDMAMTGCQRGTIRAGHSDD